MSLQTLSPYFHQIHHKLSMHDLSSFAPRFSTILGKINSHLDYGEDVILFGLQDTLPEYTEEPEVVQIDSSGFSTIFR